MFNVIINEVIEVEEITDEYQRLHDKQEFDSKKDPQYGYVTTSRMREKEVQKYSQKIDVMDMTKVIKAVNGIE